MCIIYLYYIYVDRHTDIFVYIGTYIIHRAIYRGHWSCFYADKREHTYTLITIINRTYICSCLIPTCTYYEQTLGTRTNRFLSINCAVQDESMFSYYLGICILKERVYLRSFTPCRHIIYLCIHSDG